MDFSLDKRLFTIYSMVPPCQGAADVGTDHGYLICALVESGRAQWGVATDIHRQPLEKARREAARRGLSERIRLVLADGLAGVEPQGLGAVVVAGMGGETIAHILESWPHARTPGITWLFQPMTKGDRLRDWLWGSGFSVVREECCTQGKKTYSVMAAVYTGERRALPEWERQLGRVDPRRDEASLRYAGARAEELEKAAAGLRAGGAPGNLPQAERLEQAARKIREKMEDREG